MGVSGIDWFNAHKVESVPLNSNFSRWTPESVFTLRRDTTEDDQSPHVAALPT
ncbi:hypothetical protein GCM10011610_66640 [Nocardia rhizosphaerihabitans]|uniref:Uncharacterized protein n=1 Tax=Nocardia rhizosphaerihabitans TaxID=1691570 RepID=A0ABQ2L0X1_9NOCA|nr:hypothetical protein GCM10011610_66640 [Nocardia rhizosphaerihabitans]